MIKQKFFYQSSTNTWYQITMTLTFLLWCLVYSRICF